MRLRGLYQGWEKVNRAQEVEERTKELKKDWKKRVRRHFPRTEKTEWGSEGKGRRSIEEC
jgi:hypothetical protein